MCWCVRLACPVLRNLGARACAGIADFCCALLGKGSDMLVQYHLGRDHEDAQSAINIDVASPFHKDNNNTKPIDVHHNNTTTTSNPIIKQPHTTMSKEIDKIRSASPMEIHRPLGTLHKWNESFQNSGKRKESLTKSNMTERPLPVPVEKESYYMNITRKQAENILQGKPDGTFILRPSSQKSYVHTITLIYMGSIFNIGCRRRPDNMLALGYSKTREQTFLTIHELIEYFFKEKLVLLVDGENVGSTVLKRLKT